MIPKRKRKCASGAYKKTRAAITIPDLKFIVIFYFFSVMANKRKLREEWLHNEEFQPWLTRVDGDDTKAFCSKCHKTFDAGLTTIKRHMVRNIYVLEWFSDFIF